MTLEVAGLGKKTEETFFEKVKDVFYRPPSDTYISKIERFYEGLREVIDAKVGNELGVLDEKEMDVLKKRYNEHDLDNIIKSEKVKEDENERTMTDLSKDNKDSNEEKFNLWNKINYKIDTIIYLRDSAKGYATKDIICNEPETGNETTKTVSKNDVLKKEKEIFERYLVGDKNLLEIYKEAIETIKNINKAKIYKDKQQIKDFSKDLCRYSSLMLSDEITEQKIFEDNEITVGSTLDNLYEQYKKKCDCGRNYTPYVFALLAGTVTVAAVLGKMYGGKISEYLRPDMIPTGIPQEDIGPTEEIGDEVIKGIGHLIYNGTEYDRDQILNLIGDLGDANDGFKDVKAYSIYELHKNPELNLTGTNLTVGLEKGYDLIEWKGQPNIFAIMNENVSKFFDPLSNDDMKISLNETLHTVMGDNDRLVNITSDEILQSNQNPNFMPEVIVTKDLGSNVSAQIIYHRGQFFLVTGNEEEIEKATNKIKAGGGDGDGATSDGKSGGRKKDRRDPIK